MAEDNVEEVDDDQRVFGRNILTSLEDLEKLPTFYANATQMSFTPDDGCIIFCQRDMSNGNRAHGRFRVYMPLAQLKLFYANLEHALIQYETNFGEIVVNPMDRLTPEARKRLADQQKANGASDGSNSENPNDN